MELFIVSVPGPRETPPPPLPAAVIENAAVVQRQRARVVDAAAVAGDASGISDDDAVKDRQSPSVVDPTAVDLPQAILKGQVGKSDFTPALGIATTGLRAAINDNWSARHRYT